MMRNIQLLLVLLSGPSLLTAAPPEVQFNRDIRPILAENCFQCHGPDPGSREADMRLDAEAGFFASKDGNLPVVVKGEPEKSELYLRLITADRGDLMPPPESKKELTTEEVDLIRTWIQQGAPWQGHWALIPPTRPELPKVQAADWGRTPVDQFILARLEQAGLSPAPEADPYTLARRVSLDLTGLPPEPALVDRFAANPTDEAYLELVDTLLSSPKYGEHRARYWLDAARYGDTHGMHFDNYREMYPYRDWVVEAFNDNLPFDKFTEWQIAGDLLPDPSLEQLVATGFQRCNITTNEGGTIAEENLANYAADRVQTLGWVYMGLTTNCAQCHDHKFDPITTKDYYSLTAFFRNTTQGAMDNNSKDGGGPIIRVPRPEDRERFAALPGLIAETKQALEARKEQARGEFDEWVSTAKPEELAADLPRDGLSLHVPLNEGLGDKISAVVAGEATSFTSNGELTWDPNGKTGPAPRLKRDRTFDLGDLANFRIEQPFSFGAWVRRTDGTHAAILARMDNEKDFRGWDLWQQDKQFGTHLIDSWPEKGLKVVTEKPVLTPNEWHHVFVTYDGSGKASGVKLFHNGVEQGKKVEKDTLEAGSTIQANTSLRIGQRSNDQFYDNGFVQDVRIYERILTPGEVAALANTGPLRTNLAVAPEQRTPAQTESLFAHYLATRDEEYASLGQKVSDLEAERAAIENRSPITHVQVEKDGEPMAKVLMRGQYDKPGEDVKAAVPQALPPLPEGAPNNRLGLAQWLTSPENPLTARVTVNRFWQQVFGQGIVVTAEDFGIMGTPPSHPDLLDWLAVEFRESGWDVKEFFKLLVTSSAYRQAAITTPEKLEKDRANQLVSRGPRFRMDAEMVRDYALAASGLLSDKMGGPGVRPYQPPGIWDVVGLPGGNTRNYEQDSGENLYRRTLYNFWKRMAPPPNLEAFNAPAREVCTVRRERTNTPLQALVTMNDPQFVEAARVLAGRALAEADDERQALDYIARRALCRPLKDREVAILEKSLEDLRDHYTNHSEDARALVEVGESKPDSELDTTQLAAWTMLCNQILNLDEVLNK